MLFFGKEEIDQLASAFSLHPVEIESLQDDFTRPHLVEYPDHLYVNFTYLEAEGDELNSS